MAKVWFCSLGFFQVNIFKKLGLKVNSEIPGKTHSSFFFFLHLEANTTSQAWIYTR